MLDLDRNMHTFGIVTASIDSLGIIITSDGGNIVRFIYLKFQATKIVILIKESKTTSQKQT